MANIVKGRMHCPRCDLSIEARCVIKNTRRASFVSYDGHAPRGGTGLKGRCKGGTIMFAAPGFPQWAHRAVNTAVKD